MSIVSWKIGEWGEEFGGTVGGGTVLGSTIRPFYRLRFSIAHAIQDPYRAGISIALLFQSLDLFASLIVQLILQM